MVRVVGEAGDNEIHPIREAIRMADEAGLDLVEISPSANPPVCKIMDYKKFLFDQKKKQKEIKAKATKVVIKELRLGAQIGDSDFEFKLNHAKKKSAKIVIKEIRLGPQTDDHDFEFKCNHAIRFLKEGCKVKVDVFFHGRSIAYKEQGELVLLKFAQALEDVGKVESLPKLEGKRMLMIIAPKK